MLFLALRNLLRRRLRSSLTALGVALGTAAFLVIVTTVDGLLIEAQEGVDSLGTDISLLQAGATVPWLSHLAPPELERIQDLPGVRAATPVVVGLTRLDARSRFMIFGVAPDSRLMQQAEIVDGNLPRSDDEIVVGASAASRLGLATGDRVELMRRELSVVGVYRTGRALLDSGAVVDIPIAQALFNLGDRVSIVFLDLENPATSAAILDTIAARMPEVDATPSDVFTDSIQRIGMVRRYGRQLAILAFLIAALGVCNTLAMNLSERTREIAILRAIGWRRARIAGTVVIETLLLVAIGAFLALPLSEIALAALHGRDSYGVIPADVPTAALPGGVLLAAATGFLLSLIPLVHSLRVRTSVALRS